MTTTVLSPSDLDSSHDDNHIDDTSAPVSKTEGEQTFPAGEVVSGEVVTGPLHLNLGDDRLPTIRAGLLDPAQLHDNPRNPRTKPYDLGDILTSVRERGVRVPLLLISMPPGTPPTRTVVDSPSTPAAVEKPGTAISQLTDEQIASLLAPGTPPEMKDTSNEQFMILMGHRRKYAAIEAGRDQVPCWIVPDEGVASQIVDMLVENGHRTALTATEEAEAYHQLTLEGLSPDEIAAIRAVPTSVVKTALRARELPQQAQRALDKGTLTLEQAMALEEFKDSKRASDRLLGELDNEWRFKQALASEREKRDYATAKEREKARLLLDGVKTTGKPAGYGYDSPAVAVEDLVDADGNHLDVEQVKKLPGVAAFVEKVGAQARTVVYCEDPAALGYTKRPRPSRYGMSPEQAAAEAQRKQQEAERRHQMKLAEGVRQEFIVAAYGTAKAARKLYLEALRATVTGQNMGYFDDLDELYKALGGADHDTLTTAGEDRLRRALVAKWVCRQELNLTYTVTSTWNLKKDAAVAWYDRLIAEGYPLTDVEADLYQSLTDQHENPDEDDTDTLDDDVDDDQADEDRSVDSPAISDPDDLASDTDGGAEPEVAERMHAETGDDAPDHVQDATDDIGDEEFTVTELVDDQVTD